VSDWLILWCVGVLFVSIAIVVILFAFAVVSGVNDHKLAPKSKRDEPWAGFDEWRVR
jgi:hypothetical protein